MKKLPDEFEDDEIIVRSIFSKMVLRDPKKGAGLKALALTPYPKEKVEISYRNRLKLNII